MLFFFVKVLQTAPLRNFPLRVLICCERSPVWYGLRRRTCRQHWRRYTHSDATTNGKKGL